MQNCYVPRAVPKEGRKKQEHGEVKVASGENGAPGRIQDGTSGARADGRTPYDMRQHRQRVSRGRWADLVFRAKNDGGELLRTNTAHNRRFPWRHKRSRISLEDLPPWSWSSSLQVFMDVGVIAHATGSAYVEFNHTKVICAVYGPHAQSGRDSAFSEEGQLQCEFSYAPFATPGGRRESRGGKKDDERELSTLLRQTLESSVQVHRLTKSVVGVHVMVLQADGGELAIATTCASMALADAGIELYDLVTSCAVGFCGTQMVLDPTKEEERLGAGIMTVALMPGSQQITQWWQEGRFDGRRVAEALELCTDGCGCVHKMMETKLMTISSARK